VQTALFNISGPQVEKLIPPNRLFGERHRFWCQQSKDDGQWAILDGTRQSSARYDGARPTSDWNTNPASLKRIRWRSGNQCS